MGKSGSELYNDLAIKFLNLGTQSTLFYFWSLNN